MPFSEPVADGPIIQCANLRAFKAGITTNKIFTFVEDFRKKDFETPIILMGYANPVYSYGIEKFVSAAQKSGVDGMIVADLPPEEDSELRAAAGAKGIDVIHLITPTTDAARLQVILKGAGGFLYYVSVAGTTGGKQAVAESVRRAVETIRPHSELPIAVGFGISTTEQAREIAKTADAAIVASAIIDRLAANLDEKGAAKRVLVKDVLGFVETLARATHGE